jgi:hypothetical protein
MTWLLAKVSPRQEASRTGFSVQDLSCYLPEEWKAEYKQHRWRDDLVNKSSNLDYKAVRAL